MRAIVLLHNERFTLQRLEAPKPEDDFYRIITSDPKAEIYLPFWRAGECASRILSDMIEISSEAKASFEGSCQVSALERFYGGRKS